MGGRSVGVTRCHGYGATFSEYIRSANDAIAVVVQAEHIQAVRNIEAILQVPGIDGIFIGPYDLSASLNKAGQLDDPEVQAAIAQVKTACDVHDTPTSIFCPDLAAAQKALQAGYTFPAVGIDGMVISGQYRQMVNDLRLSLPLNRNS
jgi:2-dehydro-3-deoxyglucarate aldolase/4-hydroxy-2-oxoheptanedioate aldolase